MFFWDGEDNLLLVLCVSFKGGVIFAWRGFYSLLVERGKDELLEESSVTFKVVNYLFNSEYLNKINISYLSLKLWVPVNEEEEEYHVGGGLIK